MTYYRIHFGWTWFLSWSFTIIRLPRSSRERVRPDEAWVVTQAIGRRSPRPKSRDPPTGRAPISAAFSFV